MKIKKIMVSTRNFLISDDNISAPDCHPVWSLNIHVNIKHYLGYMLFLIFVYGVTFCYANYAVGLGVENLEAHVHYDRVFQMIIFLTVPYLVSNYYNTFNHITALSTLVTTFVYQYIITLSVLSFSLINPESWTVNFLVGIIIVFSFIGFVLTGHIYYAYQKKILIKYFFLLAVPITYVIGALIVYCFDKNVAFHLHHWILAYVCYYYTVCPNVISRVCAGVVLAVFINGVVVYGFDSIFY